MRPKKVPMRMCVGCHTSREKKEMIRVVRLPDRLLEENPDLKSVCIDSSGKTSGRGAYLCKNPECFKLAKKGKKLDKALETVLSDELYDELIERVQSSAYK